MNKEYIAYECDSCRSDYILTVIDKLAADRQGKYISCPYCGSKAKRSGIEYDSIKECMKSRSYKRNSHGAIEEII